MSVATLLAVISPLTFSLALRALHPQHSPWKAFHTLERLSGLCQEIISPQGTGGIASRESLGKAREVGRSDCEGYNLSSGWKGWLGLAQGLGFGDNVSLYAPRMADLAFS